MAVKNPQTIPGPAPAPPVLFDESLAVRCFPFRFRLIGSPFAYLDNIGVAPILEFIYKGNMLIDVAEATNVPFSILRQWVEDRQHFTAIEEAETVSAEGWLSRGQAMVMKAPTEFELRKAKEILRHAQFMAQKKNKPIYGDQVEKNKGSTVHYQFNIQGAPEAAAIIPALLPHLEGEHACLSGPTAEVTPTSAPLVSLNMSHLFNQPILVADRPKKPTYNNPDVGPFYDDPMDQENTRLPAYGEA